MSEMMKVPTEIERDEELMKLIPMATELYIFGYPLVVMELARQLLTNVSRVRGMKAPMGQFAHTRSLPDDTSAEVARPNPDVLYSSAWLDLKEPYVLSVPDTGGRYYFLTILDAWTNIVASIGSRTTGNGKGDFVLVGQSYKGKLPSGPTRIDSPTDLVWVVCRIGCHGEVDYDPVNVLQDQFRLVPSRDWRHKSLESLHDIVMRYEPRLPTRSDETKRPVVDRADGMDATMFHSLLCDLLMYDPPYLEDRAIVEKMVPLGMRAGEPFDPERLDAVQLGALEEGAKRGQEILRQQQEKPLSVPIDGYLMPLNMGRYGTNYLLRATVARINLGAGLPEDIVAARTFIDSDGRPLVGEKGYVLRFTRDRLPPVNAFWSVALYGPDQLYTSNPIGRYAIGDRNGPRFNEDGSLDIFIQRDSPGAEKEPNWLPAPLGGFSLMFRLYWPKAEVLTGEWVPPAPVRSDRSAGAASH